ncbi:MAG: hypothetical protein GY845_27850 [Planctomycetes bacterium]|nr:hypothetical protein [Planctomycetota bacterium]
MSMEKPENHQLDEAKISVKRRLTIIVPCLIVILLFQSLMDSKATFPNNRMRARLYISVFSGPLSSWIEFSWQTTRREKALSLAVAPVLLLGIFTHLIKPHIITGVITFLSTFFWYFWGVVVTYAGF